MDKIRVAIADDNKLMADVLEEIIQQDQDMEIVGKASDGEEAYQLIRSKHPDVMLLDMPSGCGDIPLDLYTTFPVDGTIAVTNPGALSVEAVQRCINLCMMLMSPTVAYVENKSFADSCVSSGAYELPHGCVTVSVPFSGEIAVAGEEGTLEGLNCAELNPVADLIATAVKVSSDKAAKAKK